ncbi:MAG: hypothetical protein ACHQ17_07945, partial [Polyangia bacterium]
MRAEQSRAIRAAAKATGARESELEETLNAATTHLRVDPSLPGALTTSYLLAATLLRSPGKVTIDERDLSATQLEPLHRLSAALRGAQKLPVGLPPPGATQIAIGERPAEIRVIPDGHGARLHREGTPAQLRPPSILGVLLASAFAAGEAFKDAAQISEQLAARHSRLAFCPVTLSGDLDAAPPARADWQPLLTFAGIGAIGTAHVLLLAGLARGGTAVLIDRQVYAAENLGTYTLGDMSDLTAATPKVLLAERTLAGWRCHRHQGDIDTAIGAVDANELPWTAITLAGLDSPEARRDTQRLQSDRLLDAGTGDTAVGLRDTRAEGPCLSCMLGKPTAPPPSKPLTDLGIPLALAQAPGDAVVDEQLIAAASSEKARMILTAQRGTPICGLVRAAGLSALASEDYMASVPFVSQQAACLTVGRLLAIETGIEEGLPNFFQYETLLGPEHATRQNRRADPACNCQQRAETIAAVRRERRARAAT